MNWGSITCYESLVSRCIGSGSLFIRGRGLGREMSREEMGQETKSKEGARAQPCATHSRHSTIFPVFIKSTSNKLYFDHISSKREKCEVILTCEESDTVVSCVLYIPIGISQVVEQSFWYNLPYVLIHMSSFVIRIYNRFYCVRQ